VVQIEECRPISKRKTWLVVVRNGEGVVRPEFLADAPAAEAAAAASA
jgi:small subunit ribosomal protein S17